MSDFVEQLKLAEKAAEDIYFAKVNRALIESLRKRMQTGSIAFQPSDQTSAEPQAEDSLIVMKETSAG